MTIKAARILWRQHKDGKAYPYYQRFYPAAVRQMLRDMGRDQKVVKRLRKLSSDCTEAELLTARDKEDELFDRMAEGLNSANARELTAAAAQKSAIAYLSARGQRRRRCRERRRNSGERCRASVLSRTPTNFSRAAITLPRASTKI